VIVVAKKQTEKKNPQTSKKPKKEKGAPKEQ
jgi:hypothetical protein